jgi:beta-galactosidase
MGLGGDDSWSPRVHEEYLLPAKTYSYSFRLKAVDKASDTDRIVASRLPYIDENTVSELSGNASELNEAGEETDVEIAEPVRKPVVKKAPVRKKTVSKRKPARKRRRR